jgi:hypothetical protein
MFEVVHIHTAGQLRYIIEDDNKLCEELNSISAHYSYHGSPFTIEAKYVDRTYSYSKILPTTTSISRLLDLEYIDFKVFGIGTNLALSSPTIPLVSFVAIRVDNKDPGLNIPRF